MTATRPDNDALILDISIALFVPLVYGLLLPRGIRALSPESGGVIGCLVPFLVTLYLGRVYARYTAHNAAGGLVFYSLQIVIITVSVIPMVILDDYGLFPRAWFGKNPLFLFLPPLVFGMSGVLAGFRREHLKEWRPALLPMLAVTGLLALFIALGYLLDGKHGPAGLVLAGSAAVLFVPMLLVRLAARLFPHDRHGRVSAALARIGGDCLLPLCFTAALLFWNELQLLQLLHEQGPHPSLLRALLASIASGMIPLRLTVALIPPRTRYTLPGAAVSLTIFVISSWLWLRGM